MMLAAAGCLAAVVVGVVAQPVNDSETSPPPFSRGVIDRVDPYTRQLTLRTAHGLETYGWTDRTTIFLGDQKLTADKLQMGDQIALRHGRAADGQLLALRIKVYREDTPRRVPVPLPPEP